MVMQEPFYTISIVIDAKNQVYADRVKSNILKFLQTQQDVKVYIANARQGYLPRHNR